MSTKNEIAQSVFYDRKNQSLTHLMTLKSQSHFFFFKIG